ncbi:hypothetical protein JCM11251_005652, partial [Rhodosporidiobolus azoricus]
QFLHRYHLGRRQPLAGRMGQTFAVLSHYVTPAQLASIGEKVPRVAIIHGDEDELIHVERGNALHKAIPNSTLKIVPHAGHALPSQITEEYNDWVKGIVQEAHRAQGVQMGGRGDAE